MTWIDCSKEPPPHKTTVLVCKWYLDAEFDFETGGYSNKQFWDGPHIEIDMMYHSRSPVWGTGGTATHWMAIPEAPKEPPA